MIEAIDAQPATTEHCSALPQCDDDGSGLAVDAIGPCRRDRGLGLDLDLEALLWLQHREAAQAKRKFEEEKRRAQEARTRRLHLHLDHLQLQLRQSMGEGGSRSRSLYLTRPLVFTFASLPVCRSGMNRRDAFTVCITLDFPYRVMSLHRTISTAIRAVDDNQVRSHTDNNHRRSPRPLLRWFGPPWASPASHVLN